MLWKYRVRFIVFLSFFLQLNNFKVQQKLDILNSVSSIQKTGLVNTMTSCSDECKLTEIIFLSQVFSYFHAQYTFFHQGFDLLRDLEPTMKTMASQVTLTHTSHMCMITCYVSRILKFNMSNICAQLSQLSTDCAAKRKDLENTHLLVQQRVRY